MKPVLCPQCSAPIPAEAVLCPYCGVHFEPGERSSPGKFHFQDDFSNPASGWDVRQAEFCSVGYSRGEYVFQVNRSHYFMMSNAGRGDLADIHIEVTALSAGSAKDAAFGIVCSYRDPRNYYYLGISLDGFYAIVKTQNAQDTILTSTTNQWSASDKLVKNAASYRLAVEFSPGKLVLFANGIVIATAYDITYAHGDVGLFAFTFEQAPAEIHFKEFVAKTV